MCKHYTKNSLIHYIVVRRDLPLGTIAAQVTHAAGESFAWGVSIVKTLEPQVLVEAGPVTAVVLEARNRQHLVAIKHRLKKAKVPFLSINEPDAPYNGQLMALGIIPGFKDDLKPHFLSMKLLRDNHETKTKA